MFDKYTRFAPGYFQQGYFLAADSLSPYKKKKCVNSYPVL